MTLNLDDMEAVARAATPGKWSDGVWCGEESFEWAATGPRHKQIDDGWHELDPDSKAGQLAQKDAAHIAAFNPQTALALISALRTAREALEHTLKHYEHPMHEHNWAYYTKEVVVSALAKLDEVGK